MRTGLRNELIFCGGALALLAALTGSKKTSLALAASSLWLLALPQERWNPQGQLVVITGGSRGLGFALAKEFLQQGAKVALVARDQDELVKARALLLHQIPSLDQDTIHLFCCDITETSTFEKTLDAIAERCGPITAFVNNAGSIIVGPLEAMSEVDFKSHFNLHVLPVIQSTKWLAKHFGARGGRIINISSIGGRIAVPHMSPYVTTKFALGGFSETAAVELAPRGIRVTTVYPGLMQTGSPSKALFKGSPEKEYAWFAASDVTPGLSIKAQTAAEQIIRGVCAGDSRIILTWAARAGNFGYSFLPEIFTSLMGLASRLLPDGSDVTLTLGSQARSWADTKTWFRPFKSRLRDNETQLNQ